MCGCEWKVFVFLLILDMKRIFTQLFRQVERNVSGIAYQQQRMIQKSTSRFQSVEEVRANDGGKF